MFGKHKREEKKVLSGKGKVNSTEKEELARNEFSKAEILYF